MPRLEAGPSPDDHTLENSQREITSMRTCLAILTALAVGSVGTIEAGVIVDSGMKTDHYIGSDDHGYGDVIGGSQFQIHSSGVLLTNSSITFTINTNFVATPGQLGTRYGDLFFTFDGYTPHLNDDAGLTSPWYGHGDHAGNGTTWTHAIHLDSTASELLGDSGSVKLYSVDSNGILLSDDFAGDFPNNAIYRNGQEVRVNTADNGNQILATSNGGWARDLNAKTLTISVDLDTSVFNLSNGQIAWHWSMACGNDTVEDFATFNPVFPPPPNTVPEPHSLAVFGFAALGLLGARYRNRRRSAVGQA